MEFASDVLTLEQEGLVATLWLDRPEHRNALGLSFWADLPAAMQRLSGEPSVRAIILAARGPAFTIGLDLKAMGGLLIAPQSDGSDAAQHRRLYREIKRMQAAISSVAACPKPVIAAVHGHCIGGGVDLITACDIRLAAADASFSVRETKLAMVADLGTLQRLPRLIGKGHVAELVYTGKDINAERARAIGLVNDVYENRNALLDAARSLAEAIAANSALAVQGAKAVLRACEDRSVEEGLDYVALWNTSFLRSDDLAEAIAAFREKRAPSFDRD